MKAFWPVVVLAVLCALGGWFLRGYLDFKGYEQKLAHADSLQVRLDSTALEVARMRLQVTQMEAQAESAILVQQHERLAQVQSQQKIIDSLKKRHDIPADVQTMIADLETHHEQERQSWVAETQLLRAQLAAEKQLRIATEAELDSTKQVNTDIRNALKAKPNQVVLTNAKVWKTATFVLAGLLLTDVLAHRLGVQF